jgi:molecular chaperone DnaK
MPDHFLGIDLGTTFSAIARINERGTPEIIPNSEGAFITPSVVLFDGEEITVGADAQRNAVAYPGQVVEFIKRAMGDRDYTFSYNGKTYTPSDISSFILKKLKTDTEEQLHTPIRDVVITVPAYFGILQKEATLEAGKKAGLNVLQLLNEPTAAAYSYGLHTLGKDQTVLVFDLGGGTLDVTILAVHGTLFEVKATEGDFHLGGKDWDDIIIQSLVKEFRGRYGINPFDDPAAYAELRDKAVTTKIALSLKRKATLTYGYKAKVLTHEFSQEEFTRLASSLVYRCRLLIDDTFASAKLSKDRIDHVLLAGGSTRMPMIRQMLKDYFGKDPGTELNPDECVAKGAAIKAALLQKEKWSLPSGQKIWTLPSALTDSNVTSHSFGMVAEENGTLINSVIIPKNTPYPCSRERSDYTTSYDNQETLDIYLIEGESKDPKHCVILGKYEVYDIPKRPVGETTIKVTYRYNESGVVEVGAVDERRGKGKQLPIKMVSRHVDISSLSFAEMTDIPLYGKYAGQTRIKGALSDRFGNAAGNQYDLGRDGAFGDFHVHIFNAVGNNMALAIEALKEKGFSVTASHDIGDAVSRVGKHLDVLWIISGHYHGPSFNEREIQELVEFHKSGKGLYVWTDNDPYFGHANQILPRLLGTKVIGDTPANRVLKEGDGIQAGTFKEHLITTGIVNLYEGVTISYPEPLGRLIPLATSSDGHPVISCYDGMHGEGRILVDCGFTKLSLNWDTAGTGRYVKNATVWLLGLERKRNLRR